MSPTLIPFEPFLIVQSLPLSLSQALQRRGGTASEECRFYDFQNPSPGARTGRITGPTRFKCSVWRVFLGPKWPSREWLQACPAQQCLQSSHMHIIVRKSHMLISVHLLPRSDAQQRGFDHGQIRRQTIISQLPGESEALTLVERYYQNFGWV